MRKKLAFFFLLSLVLVSSARSQITFGPQFTIGGSGSAGGVANGTKTDYELAWSVGGLGLLPLTENFSLGLGLVYDSRGIKYYNYQDANSYLNYRLGYFSLQPSIKIKQFFLGLGIGLPVSASATDAQGDATSKPLTLQSANMATLFELRMGGMIDLNKTPSGSLRLMLFGAYPLSSIAKTGNLFQSTDNNLNNGPLVTAQIGLSYLFGNDLHSPVE